MGEGLNRVLLLGNLGADPELRMTAGGQAVLKLRLATTESYLDKDSVRKERTEWHSVTVWGKRGEALAKILARGSNIFVEGALRTSSYEKDGEKRYRTEIVASNILLAGSRGGGEGGAPRDARQRYGDGQSSTPSASRSGPAPAPKDDYGDYGVDDDIPF